MTPVPITDRAELADRVRAAAFTIGEEYDGAGRQIIHSFAGLLGADWDLAAVLDVIERADELAWVDGLAGHDLGVAYDEGGRRRVLYFQVSRA